MIQVIIENLTSIQDVPINLNVFEAPVLIKRSLYSKPLPVLVCTIMKFFVYVLCRYQTG